MEKTRNVHHEFALSGLEAGDCFLGCPDCWFRFDPHTGAAPVCPECRGKMYLYDVTKEDVVERVLEAYPLVPSYSPTVGTPRDLSVSAALQPHQAQMSGQMLAAQGHIASPRLKHSHGYMLSQETPD